MTELHVSGGYIRCVFSFTRRLQLKVYKMLAVVITHLTIWASEQWVRDKTLMKSVGQEQTDYYNKLASLVPTS